MEILDDRAQKRGPGFAFFPLDHRTLKEAAPRKKEDAPELAASSFQGLGLIVQLGLLSTQPVLCKLEQVAQKLLVDALLK